MQAEEQRAIKATAEYGQMKTPQHSSLLLSNEELSRKKNVCVCLHVISFVDINDIKCYNGR